MDTLFVALTDEEQTRAEVTAIEGPRPAPLDCGRGAFGLANAFSLDEHGRLGITRVGITGP